MSSAVHFGNQVALLHHVAIFLVERHLHVCLKFLKDKFYHREPGKHTVFLGNQAGMLFLVGRDRPFASHIASTHVLGKGQADHGQGIFYRENRG